MQATGAAIIAAVEAAPVVETAAGGSIRTGIWALVALMVPAVGAILLAIVKEWGPWKKVDSEARAADFTRLREEILSQNGRIEKLEGLVERAGQAAAAANAHAMRSDAKLQTALTACEVLSSLVEREMPNAPELKLVKRLLAQAAADDLGVGDGMRKIASMTGAGE